MAKRRKSYSKKSYSSKGRKSYARKGRSSGGGRTIKIVVQAASAPQAMSPLSIPGTTLVSGAKPGRAKF